MAITVEVSNARRSSHQVPIGVSGKRRDELAIFGDAVWSTRVEESRPTKDHRRWMRSPRSGDQSIGKAIAIHIARESNARTKFRTGRRPRQGQGLHFKWNPWFFGRLLTLDHFGLSCALDHVWTPHMFKFGPTTVR